MSLVARGGIEANSLRTIHKVLVQLPSVFDWNNGKDGADQDQTKMEPTSDVAR